MTGPAHPPHGLPPGGTHAGPVPYWVPAEPAPRPRRSRWLTVRLPVAGGLLLLGGCGVAIAHVVDTVGGELGPARDAAESYAQALVDGRWEDAHAELCAEVRADVTPDDLAAHYADPDLTGYRLDGVNVQTENGRSSADATLTLTYADGWQDHLLLPLADDDGSWRPCP